MIYGSPRRIGLRSCPETAKDSTAFGSTINGASASRGGKETPTTWESRIIAERSMVMTKKKLAPVHPGEVLLEEFLKPMGLSQKFWLGLQSDYDLDVASDELGSRLEQEVKIHAGVG